MPEERPQKLWMKNGKLLVNSDGQPVLSDHCCCESDSSICCYCPEVVSYVMQVCQQNGGTWQRVPLLTSVGSVLPCIPGYLEQTAAPHGQGCPVCGDSGGGGEDCSENSIGDHLLYAVKQGSRWEYDGACSASTYRFHLNSNECSAQQFPGRTKIKELDEEIRRCGVVVPKDQDCPCSCYTDVVDMSVSLPHLKAYAVMYNVTAWQPLATEPPDQVWYWGDEPNDESLEPVVVKEVRVLPHWQVASYLVDNSMCTATLRCTRSFPVSYHDFVIGGMERPQSFCQVVDGNPVVTTSDYSDNYASNEVDLAGGSRFYDGFPLQPRPDWTTQDGRMMSVWSADWMDGAGLYSRVDDGWGIYDELVKTALRAEWTGEEITGTTKNRVRVVQPLMVRRDNQMTAHSFVFGSDQWGTAKAAALLTVKGNSFVSDCGATEYKDRTDHYGGISALFIREARGASKAMQDVDIEVNSLANGLNAKFDGNPCWLYRNYIVTSVAGKLPSGRDPFSLASSKAPELWDACSDFTPVRCCVKGALDFCPEYTYAATLWRYASCTLDGDDNIAPALKNETGNTPYLVKQGGSVGLDSPGFCYSQYVVRVAKDSAYHVGSFLHLDEENDRKSFRAYNQATDGYCVSFMKLDIYNYPNWYHGDCKSNLAKEAQFVPQLEVDESEWYIHEYDGAYVRYQQCHWWPSSPACRIVSSQNPCGFVSEYSSQQLVFPRYFSIGQGESWFPYGVDPSYGCLHSGHSYTVSYQTIPQVFPGIYQQSFIPGAYLGDQTVARYDVLGECSREVNIKVEGGVTHTSVVSSSWRNSAAQVYAMPGAFLNKDDYYMRTRTNWFGKIPCESLYTQVTPEEWSSRMAQSNVTYVSFFENIDGWTLVQDPQAYSVYAWPALACHALNIGGMAQVVYQGSNLIPEFKEELFATPDRAFSCGDINRHPSCLECRDIDQYPDWLVDIPDGTVQKVSTFASVGVNLNVRRYNSDGLVAGYQAQVDSALNSQESYTISRGPEEGGILPDAEPHPVVVSWSIPVTYRTSKKDGAEQETVGSKTLNWNVNLGSLGVKTVRCGSKWLIAPQNAAEDVVFNPPGDPGIVCDSATGLTYAFGPPSALPTTYTSCIPGTIALERGSNWYKLTRTLTMQVNSAASVGEGTGNYCGKFRADEWHEQHTTMHASWGYMVSFTFPEDAGDPNCNPPEEEDD